MVRGVIAFALGLKVEGENEDFITTVVMFIVLITTIFGSSLLKTFSDCVGLKNETGPTVEGHAGLSRSLIEENNFRPPNFDLESGGEGGKDEDDKATIREKLTHFENQYMKPLFKKAESEHFNYEIEIGEMMQEVQSDKAKK